LVSILRRLSRNSVWWVLSLGFDVHDTLRSCLTIRGGLRQFFLVSQRNPGNCSRSCGETSDSLMLPEGDTPPFHPPTGDAEPPPREHLGTNGPQKQPRLRSDFASPEPARRFPACAARPRIAARARTAPAPPPPPGPMLRRNNQPSRGMVLKVSPAHFRP